MTVARILSYGVVSLIVLDWLRIRLRIKLWPVARALRAIRLPRVAQRREVARRQAPAVARTYTRVAIWPEGGGSSPLKTWYDLNNQALKNGGLSYIQAMMQR